MTGPRVILLMGVSGCGKTAAGALLAARMGGRFIDADDLHPPENKAKMAAKIPLTDDDRAPWMARVRMAIDEAPPGPVTVVACSALRRRYREVLTRGAERIRIVHLRGSFDLIKQRLDARRGHFMPPDLLRSQFAALEEPAAEENVLTVSIEGTVEEVVSQILRQLAATA